jgi:hypothetical protein
MGGKKPGLSKLTKGKMLPPHMKFINNLASVTLLVLFAVQLVFSQEAPKAILIDEFGKICSEDFMARYDNFLIQLQNAPTAKGYFIFYGDRNVEGRNVNYINAFRAWYPAIHRFDASKLIVLRGDDRDEMHVQLWVVPAGAEPPKPDKDYVRATIVETVLYDRNWADFYNGIEGKGPLEIYSNGFFDLGCEFAPNVGGFAKTLFENTELIGYLITYTKFGRGVMRGTQVGQFAINALVKNYKVPRKRLKLIYGGNRKEPEIELWLVPKDQKPPVPTPDKKSS